MTSGSVFNHPWLGGLFADEQINQLLTAEAQLSHMRKIESAYALALGTAGCIDQAVAQEAAQMILDVPINHDGLKAGATADGVVVPNLVQQLKSQIPERLHPAVHFGLTSQDVIDTALILSLREVLTVMQQRIFDLQTGLQGLRQLYGVRTLMGRTRMQAALPITVADRLNAWSDPLPDQLTRLAELRPRLLRLQFGGPVGTREKLGNDGDAVAAAMADQLALGNPDRPWHTSRDTIAELGSWLSLVSGTLGKIGQDVALMAQMGPDEIMLFGGGSSSAMPHKQNPVLAELLQTLSRFNAGQLGCLHQTLIHEQERSGVAWALEWMVLPQMLLATGRGLSAGADLVKSVKSIGAVA